MRMQTKKILALALPFVVAAVSRADPQEPGERDDALKAVKQIADRFPEDRQRALSGGALNLFHVAQRLDKIRSERGEVRERDQLQSEALEAGARAPAGYVSDPSTDFIQSRVSGFTQSETSTAWCGNNVVVGFNDSGSLFETLPLPRALSFNGVARSENKGISFTDLGFLNGGPNFFDILAGDPVLLCADSNTFFYSSLFETFTPPSTLGSAISVSRSVDGGLTWGDPIVAVGKDGLTHFLDKDWFAIDPTDTKRLYVTYTDFDDSGSPPPGGCGTTPSGNPIPRAAIELVRSTDGGLTWSTPVVIVSVCGSTVVQGSQIAVGPGGEVHVAWERFASFPGGPREIDIRKSTDHGLTFGPAVKVDDVTCIGGCYTVRGGFRAFIDLQGLAIDRSGTATSGHLYVSWHDGRNLRVPDLDSFNGFYNFGDVLVSRSIDGGATWSAPFRVNSNGEPRPPGEGSDQFMPGVAVDKTGQVAACWYDRRNDPFNFLVERWCATSRDGGTTWSNARHVEQAFPPFHATDFEVNPFYMGDYDGLASDSTEANPGFVGAFQFISTRGNPDVRSTRLP
jgi:hypothetical protein